MIDDASLRALAATQRGLVTIAQARDLGLSLAQRHRLFDGQRWERATPRVVRLVGSTESVEQRGLVAVLDAGTGGALSGASAAAWWDIPGNELEPFHVVRDRDRSGTPRRGDRRHEPTLLPTHHTVVLDGIRTEVPARALFDIASPNDPGTGVMRHADAGYPAAVEHAKRTRMKLPGVTDQEQP